MSGMISSMKLYKYRSLANFEHVLDIILNRRLYCSKYDDLNDPFEGLFKAVTGGNLLAEPGAVAPLMGSTTAHKSVSEVADNVERICSLSSSMKEVRLWSHYADGHKGVAFEIDFAGAEWSVNKVNYSKALPVFTGDKFKRTTFLTGLPHRDVLLCKTDHWDYEAEYRIFHNSEFFNISNRLTAIYLGTRIDSDHHNLLTKITPPDIQIFTTKINKSKITVESDIKIQ